MSKSAGYQSGTTPIPNRLLDEAMPLLSDTELRVLMVVCRATLGWKEDEGRKGRDWLSHGQLKSRCGRASAAVSGAVESLVRRGLLAVEDESGRALATARQRRAAGSKLFFRALPGFPQSEMTTVPTAGPDLSISETEIRKAKTTKETGTKELDISLLSIPLSEDGSVRVAATQQGEVHPVTEPRSLTIGVTEAIAPDWASELITRYAELYESHFGRAPGQGRADWPPMADADSLRAAGLTALLPAFFGCDFGYVRRRGHSLASFLETAHVLRQAKPGAPPRRSER